MRPWQLLWRLAAFRPWLTLFGIGSWALITLAPIALGLIARAFFDALSGKAPAGAGLWWLAVLPLAAQAGRLAITWVSVPVNVTHRFTLIALLSRNLFRRLLRRPGALPQPWAPGDVASRFRDDTDQAATFVTIIQLLSVVAEVLTNAITVTIMLRINATVTLAALGPLVAVILVARAAARGLEAYRSRSRAAAARVSAALGELFGTVQAVQLAGAEAHAAAHVRALSDRRRAEAVRDSTFLELLRAVYFNSAYLGTGLVLLLAAQSMRAGTFTVGDFALFAAYLGRVAGFAGIVGDALARYRQAAVSLERMLALLEGAPAAELVAHGPVCLSGPLPDAPHPARTGADRLRSLEARALSYRHPGSGRGIDGVSLRVERGQLVVITGRVGAGKTTLLRVLLGLLPRDGGEILWNGAPVPDPAAHFTPPRSAHTPQVPTLFSDTLRENILLGVPESECDLPAAVRLAVLDRDVDTLERGLDTVVGPRGVRLSGGQVQRAAAARMLVRDPELLVFDDLSSALDVETEQLLWQRLRAQPGRTCLAVSHRRAALQAADRIVVLQDGRVSAEGAWADLLARSPEFRQIWGEA